MKYLIMCEGNNEYEVIRILLEHNRLIFSQDDLLGLTPFFARQIGTSGAVKNTLNLYHGELAVLRIGDTLTDALRIPKEYKRQIVEVKRYCTKPELEMLLIISEDLVSQFNRVRSSTSPKDFSKENISYNRKRYNNSTAFYRDYYGGRVDLLVESINKYKQIKRHNRDEGFLADLLKDSFT